MGFHGFNLVVVDFQKGLMGYLSNPELEDSKNHVVLKLTGNHSGIASSSSEPHLAHPAGVLDVREQLRMNGPLSLKAGEIYGMMKE
jgi:hypothetical protein